MANQTSFTEALRVIAATRMVLDRCAEDPTAGQAEAAAMAQRIVDLIGHPVTDEPPAPADEELVVHVVADTTHAGFVASIPARPGVLGQGETPADAISNLAGAITAADETEAALASVRRDTDQQLDDLEDSVQRVLYSALGGHGVSVDEVTLLVGVAMGLTRVVRAQRDEARRAPTTVAVAMIEDRHADPEAVVFATPELAIDHARRVGQKYASRPEDYEESQVGDWLFHASYSCESDRVWVVERPVQATPVEV